VRWYDRMKSRWLSRKQRRRIFMKKLLVVLLALTCLSALAFADASVGFGFGRTQFSIAAGSSVANSDITQGWQGSPFNQAAGTWPPQPRANLSLAYSGDHAAYHFQAYLDGTVLTWPGFYGTLKLVPDMFSLMIGRFDDDGWDNFRMTSPHPIRDVNNANVGRFNGWGVILDLMPKDSGFEAAVMYKTGDPTSVNVIPNVLDVGGSVDTLSRTMVNTSIAASYTLPGMLKITAGSQNTVLYTPARNIFGRVQLLMVPNLTLWADARYAGFDLTPAVSNINAELAGAYAMDPLTIVFAATFGSNDNLGTKVMTWNVYPEIYYNMGVATLGVYTSFGGSDVANSGIGIAVEPYVKLNDFNLRVSFLYRTNTASGSISTWEVPLLIDWGF
jgi:hypothetical protein